MTDNCLTPQETHDILLNVFEIDDMSTKLKSTNIKNMRHIYCYLARKNRKHSLQEIGDVINRAHCTVMHSCKTAENLITINDDLFMPFYTKAVKQIELNQVNDLKGIKEKLDYHNQKAEETKNLLYNLSLDYSNILETFEPVSQKFKSKFELNLLNKIVNTSEQDLVLRKKLKNWMHTKNSSDLLECTKHINFNHLKDSNSLVFSRLNASFQ